MPRWRELLLLLDIFLLEVLLGRLRVVAEEVRTWRVRQIGVRKKL